MDGRRLLLLGVSSEVNTVQLPIALISALVAEQHDLHLYEPGLDIAAGSLVTLDDCVQRGLSTTVNSSILPLIMLYVGDWALIYSMISIEPVSFLHKIHIAQLRKSTSCIFVGLDRASAGAWTCGGAGAKPGSNGAEVMANINDPGTYL